MLPTPPDTGHIIFCSPDMTHAKVAWLKAVLVFGIVFYLLLGLMGAKNIYEFLWEQKRYKRVTLTAIYFLSEIQCLLRIVQNSIFLSSDKAALDMQLCSMTSLELE